MLTLPGTGVGKQWSLIWDWMVTVLLYVVRSWCSIMSSITFIPSTGLTCTVPPTSVCYDVPTLGSEECAMHVYAHTSCSLQVCAGNPFSAVPHPVGDLLFFVPYFDLPCLRFTTPWHAHARVGSPLSDRSRARNPVALVSAGPVPMRPEKAISVQCHLPCRCRCCTILQDRAVCCMVHRQPEGRCAPERIIECMQSSAMITAHRAILWLPVWNLELSFVEGCT